MTRRVLHFLVAVAVALSCVTVTAQAAEEKPKTWVELLETATVNESGNNTFKLTGSSAFLSIKTPQYMRCTKVDVLISHASGQSPKFLKVRYNGGYYTLTKMVLDPYTTRFYGENIPDNLYADVVFEIAQNGTGTAYYQFLSCKVSPLNSSTYKATAYAQIYGTNYPVPFAMEYDNELGSEAWEAMQWHLVITDWEKYDRITVSGSVGAMALNSIRGTIAGLGIPYEMTYAVSNTSGSSSDTFGEGDYLYYSDPEHSYDEISGWWSEDTYTYQEYTGKVLFTLTFDLTGVDRAIVDDFYIFFVGLASDFVGFSVQLIEVIGEVDIADTTEATWWQKFVSFMMGLFGMESPEADDFKEEAAQKGEEMDELNNQLQEATKPPLSDIQVDINGYIDNTSQSNFGNALTRLTNNTLLISMMAMTLTIALVGYILFGKR